jgi:hypothetical protein
MLFAKELFPQTNVGQFFLNQNTILGVGVKAEWLNFLPL